MTTYPVVVIAGVTAALVVALALVGGLVVTGHAAELSSPSVVIVLGFCSTVVVTLLGIGGVHTQVLEVHQQVNSRLDQLVRTTSSAAHTAGFAEGQAAPAGSVPGPPPAAS